jgi:alkylation response protein AidB-like acyl-CoA dehydrogenase
VTSTEDRQVDTEVDAGDERLVTETVERLLDEHPPAATDDDEFLGAQFDAGLAWVHFPVGYGGLARSRRLQRLIDARLGAAGAPDRYGQNPIGYGMAAPTIVTLGTEEQRSKYLRPLFTAADVWCQLFSEPGAGSDVASLATRAERDGDEWVVNGQKVWTSFGHVAHYGLLLARTDPDVPKHNGMTYFVVDMRAPGVDVRPLRQMTGDAEFNEVYLTDVRIPDAERLGLPGEGWRGAVVTLMNERVSGGTVRGEVGSGLISHAVALYRAHRAADPMFRDRLMRLWIDAEVLRLTGIRAATNSTLGTPGPEGSVGKLAVSEFNKAVTDLSVDLLGAEGMLYDSYTMRQPEVVGAQEGVPQRAFLRARANSIEAGSSEIMRNILGERVLGLPGDVRIDKDVPWSEVAR